MPQIPTECPKCRRYGKVPSTKLNVTLHCKKCGAAFFVNNDGLSIIGDSPADRALAEEAAKKRAKKDFEIKLDFLDRWQRPDPTEAAPHLRRAAALAVVATLVSVYVHWKPTDPLVVRGVHLAQLLADDDKERIRLLAFADTEERAVEWVDRVRADYGLHGGSGNYRLDASIFSGGSTVHNAVLMLTFRAKDAEAPSGTTGVDAPAADLICVFVNYVKDDSGNWKLDGNETLTSEAIATIRRKQSGGPP